MEHVGANVPLKIPNPVSDASQVASVLEALSDFEGYAFNHKAMGSLFARKMLMGAAGRTGEQAIAASAQATDASRESGTMMAKQYSQLLRCCGMILSITIEDKGKFYAISPLLRQILSIKDRNQRIIQFWRYFIRSYVNPSPHSPTDSNDKLRPLTTTLRMQIDLGGGCIPWEILIGPQCQLNDDRDKDEYKSMIASIKEVRNGQTRENLFNAVIQYQKRMISGEFGGHYQVGKKQINAGEEKKARDYWNNWTRLSAKSGLNANIWELDSVGKLGYSFSSNSARMLTAEGHRFAYRTTSMRDVRAEDIEDWPKDILHAMLRVVNDNLLKEWGVEVDETRRKSDLQIIYDYDRVISNDLAEDRILHTPYSEHSVDVLIESRLLNEISNLSVHPYCNEEVPEFIEAPTIESKQLEEFPELKPFPPEPFPWQALTDSQILEKYANSDANEFGYAVGQCFQCMGMKWELGRSGDVTDRIDGKASFANGYFIPVELKSPTEVRQLNPKSVRQAAENAMQAPQIALDSDKRYKHSVATASLTIGWEFPPERSVLEDLIQRNREYWGIRIRAFVFSDLIKMARATSRGHRLDFSEILSTTGIYRWSDYE